MLKIYSDTLDKDVQKPQISKEQFSKNSKTQKLPPKTCQKQKKTKNKCSNEFMLKTKNVQTPQINKEQFSKNSKTQKLPPKILKNLK